MEAWEESSGAEFALLTPRDSPDESQGFRAVSDFTQYGEYVPREEYYEEMAGVAQNVENARSAACRLHSGPAHPRKRKHRVLGRRLEVHL